MNNKIYIYFIISGKLFFLFFISLLSSFLLSIIFFKKIDYYFLFFFIIINCAFLAIYISIKTKQKILFNLIKSFLLVNFLFYLSILCFFLFIIIITLFFNLILSIILNEALILKNFSLDLLLSKIFEGLPNNIIQYFFNNIFFIISFIVIGFITQIIYTYFIIYNKIGINKLKVLILLLFFLFSCFCIVVPLSLTKILGFASIYFITIFIINLIPIVTVNYSFKEISFTNIFYE